MKITLTHIRRYVLTAFLALTLYAPDARAQTPQGEATAGKAAAEESKQAAPAAKSPFTLRATKSAPRMFTLKAKDAKLTAVAQQLSKIIGVPVNLSPLMSQQTLNIDFSGMNLEGTLRMLAPHPYVDYVSGGDDQQPRPLAVYLYAMNERPPALNETVKSSTEALLIEGHTEEGTEEYEKEKKGREEKLSVAFANNRLSVRAKEQPLSVVLSKIAGELGIPFELGIDTAEVVNTEFNGYAVDQAIRTLSPSVRLFYRADLLNFESYPIRLALSANAGQQGETKARP